MSGCIADPVAPAAGRPHWHLLHWISWGCLSVAQKYLAWKGFLFKQVMLLNSPAALKGHDRLASGPNCAHTSS